MPEMQGNMNSAKVGYKDDAGANHQIANLLLNLASRNQHGTTDQTDVGSETEAMDLTKYRKPKSGREEKPASAREVVAKQPSPPNSLYSSMCSPFLLQNLLMQQMNPTPVQVGQPSGIPLMAGQIVAALNSLLFTLHGLQDKGVEMNVQGQLSAIYTRLQEIVTMIEHAKKEPARAATTKDPASPPSQSELHKQLELVTSTKEAEEQRIGAQLEEYQRAIAGTATSATCFPQYPPASPLSSSMLRKQQKPAAPEVTESKVEVVDVQPATGTEPASESRRGSRDSADEGPADKRMRVEEASSPASSPPSASRGARGGKGGKGIRNRVFCGDCAGCLKNDDCGSCRYCRDKTKFGGQNRLRQKCLHRRCLLDTHRRNGGSGPATTSEQGIYSGLELARLQQNSSGDHSIFSLLGGGSAAGRVPTLPSDEVEGKDENRDCREESSDRENGEQTQSRSNRWKAKHEAMLKQAGGEEGKTNQQVFESSSLVITLNETTRREEGELEGSPLKGEGPRMKSATSLDSREPARLTRRNMKPVLAV